MLNCEKGNRVVACDHHERYWTYIYIKTFHAKLEVCDEREHHDHTEYFTFLSFLSED